MRKRENLRSERAKGPPFFLSMSLFYKKNSIGEGVMRFHPVGGEREGEEEIEREKERVVEGDGFTSKWVIIHKVYM